MPTIDELINTVLIKELVSIKIDTAWRMYKLKRDDELPDILDEGATGHFDNKGALFIPGGFVIQDSNKRNIAPKDYEGLSPDHFRKEIREALKYDNATLLYSNGIATGVNLNNGFFNEMSSKLIDPDDSESEDLKSDNPPREVNSEEIAKSYCPPYITPPYGARTQLAAVIGACLTKRKSLFKECRTSLQLSEEKARIVYDNMKKSQKPILGLNNEVLAPPYLIVCNTTRYRDVNMGGLIRILGYGEFGEFSQITIEKITSDLRKDINSKNKIPKKNCVIYEDKEQYAAVLRQYGRTTPGNRARGTSVQLITPEMIGCDLKQIEIDARERYHIQ